MSFVGADTLQSASPKIIEAGSASSFPDFGLFTAALPWS
jgi:hypothetical protein